MFMTTDIADNDGTTESDATRFTPRYPVFDVDSMMANSGLSPPPNKPQKRRRRKKRQQAPNVEKQQEKSQDEPQLTVNVANVNEETKQEKKPIESPVEI